MAHCLDDGFAALLDPAQYYGIPNTIGAGRAPPLRAHYSPYSTARTARSEALGVSGTGCDVDAITPASVGR